MPGKRLSAYTPVPSLSAVYAATKGELRSLAVVLRDKSICLWSPVRGLNDETRESVSEIGRVSALVAPNYYHHAALAEYAAEFPRARLYAPKESQARLRQQTGLRFLALDKLKDALPRGVAFVSTEGLKTGEVWMRIRQQGRCAWAVVDAFGGAKGQTTARPAMLGTFPRFGVADAEAYRGWVQQRIETDKPTLVIPCHGAVFQGAGLAKALSALVRKNL